jgi:nitronate monooxygenase
MTRFTELVGCRLPVQLAAIGGVGTLRLAEAVVDSGGCGMVPRGVTPAAGSCGVNFLMPFVNSVDDIVQEGQGARIVEFFYGDPSREFVAAAHSNGALAGWQVGSAEEASAAEAAGCDYVVAQGVEAGGHVRGNQSLSELLPAVLATVTLPVVAAGGVATARSVAELLRSGADAVRVGTRFVVCPESNAHPDYVARLLEASAEDTVLTEWFGHGWEHAQHRVLRSALDAARSTGWREIAPPYREIERDVRDMAMYAGTGVGDILTIQPAAVVVEELVGLL